MICLKIFGGYPASRVTPISFAIYCDCCSNTRALDLLGLSRVKQLTIVFRRQENTLGNLFIDFFGFNKATRSLQGRVPQPRVSPEWIHRSNAVHWSSLNAGLLVCEMEFTKKSFEIELYKRTVNKELFTWSFSFLSLFLKKLLLWRVLWGAVCKKII